MVRHLATGYTSFHKTAARPENSNGPWGTQRLNWGHYYAQRLGPFGSPHHLANGSGNSYYPGVCALSTHNLGGNYFKRYPYKDKGGSPNFPPLGGPLSTMGRPLQKGVFGEQQDFSRRPNLTLGLRPQHTLCSQHFRGIATAFPPNNGQSSTGAFSQVSTH